MRSTALLILFISVSVFSQGQGVQLYEGPYESGEAVYEYSENDLHKRIFNGSFSYTEVRNMPERGGENEILITGKFKEDKKHLAWAVTVQSTDKDTGFKETIIGNYIEGEKSGLWTQRIRRLSDDSEMKFAQASFIKNHFRGPFKFKYDRPEAQGLKMVEINGGFDSNGYLDGEWVVKYTDGNDVSFVDVMRFKHGVMAYRNYKNAATGKVLESVDKESLVNGFFANMDRVDSFAVVDGQKYGIRKMKTNHRFLTPLFEAWTDLKRVNLGLDYDASIPTMIMRKGEIFNPNSLNNMATLIDWAETPKGKRELAEKKAVEDAYTTKLNVADLQYEQGNYRQAIPLYKDAYQIKNEAYPKEQIAKAEEIIRKEEEKKQLVTIVASRHELWKGNDKMLKEESYYGKKKHLIEAAMIALADIKSDLNSNYGEMLAYVDRKAYDTIDLEGLKALQTAINDAIAFQEKLKSVSKREDTKDLEKDLKKMEDPKLIIKTIMAS